MSTMNTYLTLLTLSLHYLKQQQIVEKFTQAAENQKNCGLGGVWVEPWCLATVDECQLGAEEYRSPRVGDQVSRYRQGLCLSLWGAGVFPMNQMLLSTMQGCPLKSSPQSPPLPSSAFLSDHRKRQGRSWKNFQGLDLMSIHFGYIIMHL